MDLASFARPQSHPGRLWLVKTSYTAETPAIRSSVSPQNLIREGESGEVVAGIIVDISFSGFRLEVSGRMVDALLPSSNLKDKHLPTAVRVSFMLPGTSAHSVSAKIRCNTVYSRNQEEDVYQIGVQFLEFEEGATELAEYLISKGLT